MPAPAPVLAINQPFSTVHGSVIGELCACASHTHASFSDDNEDVYHLIEEATHGTQYSASIRPFTRTKNGRGAMLALTSQFAGEDKWQQEITKAEDLMHTRKWKGTGNFMLEHFIAQHRNAYVTLVNTPPSNCQMEEPG